MLSNCPIRFVLWLGPWKIKVQFESIIGSLALHFQKAYFMTQTYVLRVTRKIFGGPNLGEKFSRYKNLNDKYFVGTRNIF
jgi:hypothetical protein